MDLSNRFIKKSNHRGLLYGLEQRCRKYKCRKNLLPNIVNIVTRKRCLRISRVNEITPMPTLYSNGVVLFLWPEEWVIPSNSGLCGIAHFAACTISNALLPNLNSSPLSRWVQLSIFNLIYDVNLRLILLRGVRILYNWSWDLYVTRWCHISPTVHVIHKLRGILGCSFP